MIFLFVRAVLFVDFMSAVISVSSRHLYHCQRYAAMSLRRGFHGLFVRIAIGALRSGTVWRSRQMRAVSWRFYLPVSSVVARYVECLLYTLTRDCRLGRNEAADLSVQTFWPFALFTRRADLTTSSACNGLFNPFGPAHFGSCYVGGFSSALFFHEFLMAWASLSTRRYMSRQCTRHS